MGPWNQLDDLIQMKKNQDRYPFRNDPERAEAQHKWMVEAINLLLTLERDRRGHDQ